VPTVGVFRGSEDLVPFENVHDRKSESDSEFVICMIENRLKKSTIVAIRNVTLNTLKIHWKPKYCEKVN
jgi:hypothetical protein